MRRSLVVLALAGMSLRAAVSCATADETRPEDAGLDVAQVALPDAAPPPPPADAADASLPDAAPPKCSLDGFCYTEIPVVVDGGAARALTFRDVWIGKDATWAVTTGGQIARYVNDAWSVERSTPHVLRAIGGSSVDDLWVGGEGGVVLRRRVVCGAATWVSVPTGTTGNVTAIHVAAAGKVWIVGDFGVLRTKGVDGTSSFGLESVTPPAALMDGMTGVFRVDGTDPSAVWMLAPNPCLDPGDTCDYGDSRLLRAAQLGDGGTRWSRADIGTDSLFSPQLAAASLTGSRAFLAGHHYAAGCVAASVDVSISDAAVSANADAGRTDAAGPDAAPVAVWSTTGVCVRERSMWMDSPRLGWAVGDEGLAQEWDGARWRPLRIANTGVPVARQLYAVRGLRTAAGLDVWIVGDGIALHRRAP